MGKKALQWSTLVKFMDDVEKASNGRVKFKRYCCKAMGSAEDSTEAVRGGSLDITVVGVGTFGKYDPAINHIVLPYLFDDYDHVYRFVSSPLWFELTKGLEKHGLKPITNVNAGFRDLLTTKKPVKTVADLKGIKVKVALIKPFLTVWEQLGAVVTPMKTTEQYMAMKTGVIQGVEMPPTNMVASKLCEVGKYYSAVKVCWLGPMMAMNLDKWNSLPADIKKVIEEQAKVAAKFGFEEGARRNNADLELLKSKYGIREVDADLDDFKKTAQEAYKIYEKEDWYDAELVKKIRGM
jgi:tripartite ATP-independent transporter DctP family solute receptor